MGVGVQRDANIRVAHEILQRLGVHTALCHVGTKCVPANVRGDFGHLHLIDAVVLLADVLEVMLPMKRHHRFAVLVQVQKAAPAVDHRLSLGLWPVGNNPLESLVHIICHGDFPCSARSFRVLDDILHVPFALKLVVDTDFSVLHIQISQRQSNKFRDAKSSLE